MIAVCLILTGLAAIAVLLYILADTAATNKQQATYTPDGGIEFVVSGGRATKSEKTEDTKEKDTKKAGVTLIRILPNIKGYCLKKGVGKFTIDVGIRRKKGKDGADGGPITDKTPDKDIVVLPVKAIISPVIDAIVPADNDEGGRSIEEREDKFPFFLGWLKPIKWYLRKNFGWFWVSIWPNRHVHTFMVDSVRQREKPERPDPSKPKITDWIDDRGWRPVTYLLWQFPRPIANEGVEFQGGLKADIAALVTMQVVMPYRPVFPYEANFFPLISNAALGAMIDHFRRLDLLKFIQEGKTGYASDFYLRVLSRINIPAEVSRKLEYDTNKDDFAEYTRKDNPKRIEVDTTGTGAGTHTRGTIPEFGIWVRNAGVTEIIPEEKVLKALQAKQLADLEGKGVYTAADWEAKATERLGQGRANALAAQKKAAGKKVLLAQLDVDRTAAFKGSTLVEGGGKKRAKPVITIPPTEKPPTPQQGGGTTPTP